MVFQHFLYVLEITLQELCLKGNFFSILVFNHTPQHYEEFSDIFKHFIIKTN